MNYKVTVILPKDAEGNAVLDFRDWVLNAHPESIDDFDDACFQFYRNIEEILVGTCDIIYENDAIQGVTYVIDLPPDTNELPEEPLHKTMMLEFLNSDNFSTKGMLSLQPV